nr:hypothetical protein GCM10020092_064060 [Actinoplanes digitatis]
MSTSRNCESRCRRSGASDSRYPRTTSRIHPKSSSAVALGSRSSIGTTVGGDAMMRRRPSTTVESFPRACRLSRVLALRSASSVRRTWVGGRIERHFSSTVCTSSWAYQTSRLVRAANSRIAVR